MPPVVTNNEIARALDDVADLLELEDANPFKIRAYRTAARTVRRQTSPLQRWVTEGRDLRELPGVGEDMAAYVAEMCETGDLTRRQEVAADAPRSLLELMRLEGLGGKRVKALWQALGVETTDDLEEACERGAVEDVPGFGERSQERILAALRDHREQTGRFPLGEADEFVEPLVAHLRGSDAVTDVTVAGSYRRRRETVGDIDVLATARDAAAVMDRFTRYSQVDEVREAGETRGAVVLGSGLEVDLRVVDDDSYGAALVYFTGSKEHSIKLRTRAIERGLRISEYGVFREEEGERDEDRPDPWSGERVAGRTEEEVYGAIDLPWVPPELREDRGEVEAAADGRLPDLVEIGDLRGDLQMHTVRSDGADPVSAMVGACADRGYDYLAITDHSRHDEALPMIEGVDADGMDGYLEALAAVEEDGGPALLRGLEVDVLRDGSLALDERTLGRVDIVLVGVHTHLDLDAAEQTERILAALAHPAVNVLAHPTGRILQRRPPIDVDLEAIFAAAAAHDVAIEINAQPERLDLPERHLLAARDHDVRFAISTDAHAVSELDLLRYGVEQARRGWVTADAVINAWPLDDLRAFLGAA